MKTSGQQFAKGILLLVLWVSLAQAGTYSGGTGEPNDPYQIATAQDLVDLGNEPNDYDKHFILTADIDLDPNLPCGQVFERAIIAPMTGYYYYSDFEGPSFGGTLDGQGYQIFNVVFDGNNFIGLFGCLAEEGIVRNVHINDGTLHCTRHAGLLTSLNRGRVLNCSANGSIGGEAFLGVFVGVNEGIMRCCTSRGQVQGEEELGGLVGENSGRITSSHATGLRIRGTLLWWFFWT